MHTLYYSPGACSLAPHVVLEEIGDPYRLERVIAKGGLETNTDAWRKVNPKARVPALTGVPGSIGGQPDLLTEAHAIMVYLARKHPGAKLLPADPASEARAIEWMNWLASNVHAMAFGQVFRPQRFVDDAALHPAIVEKGMRNLEDQYSYIESLLGDGRKWALPAGYSVVDPYLLCFYRWGLGVGMPMRERYPAWLAQTRRTLERPAVRRTFEQEGLPLDIA